MMIRKLLLPALAVAVLGGCMTGYTHRQDRGDYYYGEPSTDYRHYGSPYGYGGYYSNSYYSHHGYPGYYPGYYHSPYGYQRYPYGYYRPPLVIRPRPDGDHRPDRDDNAGKAPWRDYERLKRERIERSPVVQRPAMSVPARPAQAVRAPSPVRARSGGSRMEKIIRRAKAGGDNRSREVEP